MTTKLPDQLAGAWRPNLAERNSAAWASLTAYLTDRLAWLRVQNDKIDNSEATTAALRGAIQEVRALLDKDQPLPDVQQRTTFV